MSSSFIHRSLHHSGISGPWSRYDSGGEDRWAYRAYSRRLFAGSRPRPRRRSPRSAGVAGRQLHHRGNGVSGAGGVVGHAGRNWLSLYTAILCALCFDYFSCLPYPHSSAGGRAGMGGDGLVRIASCLVVSRVAERARKQPSRPSSGRRTWALYALSQEMMLFEDAAADPRPAGADRPHLRARRRGSLRLRPGPVLLFDRRVPASVRAHAGHDAGLESHAWFRLPATRPRR
jgi:hypothetical protein